MKTIMIACLASLIAMPAMAKRDALPIKSSGVVIHLFGPDLITTPNSTARTASTSATASNGAAAGTASAATTNSDASQPEPTMHEVLREMFVTGDPAQDSKPRFSRGRAASINP